MNNNNNNWYYVSFEIIKTKTGFQQFIKNLKKNN